MGHQSQQQYQQQFDTRCVVWFLQHQRHVFHDEPKPRPTLVEQRPNHTFLARTAIVAKFAQFRRKPFEQRRLSQRHAEWYQQQKAIQQLIDSGLVQSEKTKFTINQGAGAVPPANNANEKAAADAISSLSSSSSSTNYTSKEVEWVQCESCKKWRTVPSTMNVASLPDLWYCALNTWNETYNHCNKPQEKDSAIITSSQNNNIDLIRANSINTLNNLNTMNNNSVNAISGLPVLGGLSYGNGLSSGLSSLNSIQNMMSNVNYSNNLSNISTLNSISGINNMTNNINGMNGLHNLNGLHGLNSVNSFNNLPTGMTTTSFNDTSTSNNNNTTSSTSTSTSSTSSSSSSDAKNVSEGSTSGGGGGDDLSDAK